MFQEILDGIWGWIGSSPTANAIQIGTFIWAVIAQVTASRRRRINEHTLAALVLSENEIKALEGNNKELEETLDRVVAQLNAIDPRNWLQAAIEADSEAEDEYSILHERLSLTEDALAAVFSRLSELHAAHFPDKGRGHISEAIRFASLAAILRPEDSKARSNLAEFEAIRQIQSLREGVYISESELRSAANDDNVRLGIAAGYVRALLESGLHHYWDCDDNVMFEALTRRARRVALQRLGDVHELTLQARQFWAESMQGVGQLEVAHEEFQEILPIVKRVFGVNDQMVFDILFAQAGGQTQLGNFDRARSLMLRAERVANRIPHQDPSPEQQARNEAKIRRQRDRLVADHKKNYEPNEDNAPSPDEA